MGNSFTAVMLSAEPEIYPSRVQNCGTVPHLRKAHPNALEHGLVKYKMYLSCRAFLNSDAIEKRIQAYQDFM